MEQVTAQPVRHPDIFTDEEAAVYLHLDGPESLETIRKNYGLVGHRPAGKGYRYWKDDLDAVALKMFGRDPVKAGRLRMVGGSR